MSFHKRHTTNKETHHVTRLAKAMSAFTFGRSAQRAAGRDALLFATRGASRDADGVDLGLGLDHSQRRGRQNLAPLGR
jgi:hypothetical protein